MHARACRRKCRSWERDPTFNSGRIGTVPMRCSSPCSASSEIRPRQRSAGEDTAARGKLRLILDPGGALLDGIRGACTGRRVALCDLAVVVGDLLVGVPEVTEIDLNPVLASSAGAVPVDWRIVTA
ncbi:MAG: acetate--CoA ligase family protein [Geodermatophilaceae bacterium]